MSSQARPGESVAEWGIRMVKEEGARIERDRIEALLIPALLDGRHCRDRKAGCICGLDPESLRALLRAGAAG